MQKVSYPLDNSSSLINFIFKWMLISPSFSWVLEANMNEWVNEQTFIAMVNKKEKQNKVRSMFLPNRKTFYPKYKNWNCHSMQKESTYTRSKTNTHRKKEWKRRSITDQDSKNDEIICWAGWKFCIRIIMRASCLLSGMILLFVACSYSRISNVTIESRKERKKSTFC